MGKMIPISIKMSDGLVHSLEVNPGETIEIGRDDMITGIRKAPKGARSTASEVTPISIKTPDGLVHCFGVNPGETIEIGRDDMPRKAPKGARSTASERFVKACASRALDALTRIGRRFA